jgi:alanine racemase
MPRPILATVHAQALAHNLGVLKRAAPQSKVWAVVKANAYGHGIERVFASFRAADGFALLDLDEAQRVRDLGWRGPILLLEGVFEARDLELCSRLGLWHTVHCEEQIDMLATHKTQMGHHVFLKMNTGMNRLGFQPDRFRAAYARLNALPQVDEVTLMTHFSDADRNGGTQAPLALFQRVTQDLPDARSVCNSAATLGVLQGPTETGNPNEKANSLAQQSLQHNSDWIRPGIALYGSSPDFPVHTANDWGLQPTMSLTAKIIGVQAILPGQAVGYGSSFVAQQPMRVGVVACGYADGYPRVAPTGTPVRVDGQPSRTLGRVSMDMLCVDLTHLPISGTGSTTTLWGQGLPVDEVAQHAGTLGYELLCALAPRVPVMLTQ